MSPIKVLIVDDSAVVRQVISAVLSSDPGIEVMGTAADPLFAMEKMRHCWPDVITLDVEMPRMDGISFLRKIMAEHPTPVVICSTLTEKGAETTLQALSAGAVSIVTKPKTAVRTFLEDASSDLIAQVKAAARVRLRSLTPAASDTSAMPVRNKSPLEAGFGVGLLSESSGALAATTQTVVAIGTSTGGTQALEQVLTALPRVSAGIVIVQHMPERITTAFARRLDSICQIEVREACHNDRVIPGRALIAPGGRHMALRRSGAQYHVDVTDGPLVNRHKPSVDVLFRSVAKVAGRNALGIIMTGMGDDGAAGLLDMFNAGASTLGQDEASCVVYGMPREAFRRGAVSRQIALCDIAGEIMRIPAI
jgi:two-component system chemotaxis response regulator CheB